MNNFNIVIAPEHDGLNGKNVITSKGALHYLTLKEIKNNHDYLLNKIDKDMKEKTILPKKKPVNWESPK